MNLLLHNALKSIKCSFERLHCTIPCTILYFSKSKINHFEHGAGHKDHKCESCGKSFPQANALKKHIHTIHEGQKDCKCESWRK